MPQIIDRIKQACKEKDIPLTKMLMKAGIQTGDFYQAVNGKRPFFPAWRKRIAETLHLSEDQIFPEYENISTQMHKDAKDGKHGLQ